MGGVDYTGNASFSEGWSQPTDGPADRLNNNEAILLAAPQAGNATVRVNAHAIGDLPGHPQDYALVVAGGASSLPCSELPPPATDDSLLLDHRGDDIRLSWVDPGAGHFHVYREPSPGLFGAGSQVFNDFVQDQDPVESGVQWDDTGGALDATTRYYLVSAANSCHDESL